MQALKYNKKQLRIKVNKASPQKERCLLPQMCQQRNNLSNMTKNYSNMVSKKENDNSPEIKLEVMEDCDLMDREFKITVMKKLNELQENSERQFKELRNKINEQKEYLTKEIETQKQTNKQQKQKSWI